MLKPYLSLVKPGIIFGNLIAATGGFFLASKGQPDLLKYLFVALGTSFVVASGCVFNNVIDIDIDGKMSRTKTRPLVLQQIKTNHALFFAFGLGSFGFVILYGLTTPLATTFALLGFIVYVGFYSLYFKRHSVHGTVIGSISGACPPVIGYTAVNNRFDLGAALLFFAFTAWQMPHSYAISINRHRDYVAASIPVLPVVKGLHVARRHIIIFCTLFWLNIIGLTLFNYVGIATSILMTLGCGYWIFQATLSYGHDELSQQKWGKALFLTSVILITLFSFLIGIDYSA